MKFSFLLLCLSFLLASCAQSTKSPETSQSNGEVEQEAEQLNKGDVVPDEAAETPQNQNTQKTKVLSF